MRINWFSNAPWTCTGYGNQTKLFYDRIHKLGHDLSITAFWGLQGGIINTGDVPVFPMVRDAYGMDVIGAHAAAWGADIIITLFDCWAVNPDNIPAGIGWYPWFPIDTEPVHDLIVARIKRARKGITMSKFGQAQMAKQGIDTFYVPHGVDTKIMKPWPDRNAAKDLAHLPQNRFIVGMVAANKGNQPSRKAFIEQVTAFAIFRAQHPGALLYIHTEDGTRGGDVVNLARLCVKLGLKYGYLNPAGIPSDVDVVFPDQYQYVIGYPDDVMCATYNAFDVLLMASMGEGFGIPLIEAQACGTPVITGEWTSMGELCASGWKLSRNEAKPTWIEGFAAYMYSPDVGALVERLNAAYEVRGNLDYRARARDGMRQYDVDYVLERYWKPTLDEIARAVKGEETELELVKF